MSEVHQCPGAIVILFWSFLFLASTPAVTDSGQPCDLIATVRYANAVREEVDGRRVEWERFGGAACV